MGGGLLQLVAYGAQDVYLTGNPQITFFKVVYRRHTNFAMESIEQVFTGNVTLGKKTSCTIARNGDLVGRMYLEVDLAFEHEDNNANDDIEQRMKDVIDNVLPGHSMINYVDVEIGGQCIDKHYGEWLNIWMQLTESVEGLNKHKALVNGSLQAGKPWDADNQACNVRKLYVPLQFWFNRNPGLALPLIALQYHEVKVNIMFNKARNLLHKDAAGQDNGEIKSVKIENICLYCDYIFLDTDERRRFAQVSHEYLIEQVQFNGRNSGSGTQNVELRFNHPCKEIVWVAHDNNNGGRGVTTTATWRPFNFKKANGESLINTAVLQLNGHDRFRQREGSYFTNVQQWQHHTGGHAGSNGINLYSFALNPEEHQPSGTCNFSRIDNAVLTVDTHSASGTETKEVRVYATNYNVLRIMSGMGGLAYSN